MLYKNAINRLYLEKIASEVFDKEAAIGATVVNMGKKVMSTRLGKSMATSALAGGLSGGLSESMKPKSQRGSIVGAAGMGTLTGAATGGAVSMMTGKKLNSINNKSNLTGNVMNASPGSKTPFVATPSPTEVKMPKSLRANPSAVPNKMI